MVPPLKHAKTANENGEKQAKGLEDLSSDLRNTVNNPETSDVTIECKDGVCVHGCSWLLSVRCDVFKNLLSDNGKRKRKLSHLVLKKNSSPAMLSVFEYLYSGTIEAHVPLDWKMGFEILTAADFFDLSGLELIARGFVRNQMLNQVANLEKHVAMKMLSTVSEFEGEFEEKDELVLKLVRHLGDGWMHEDHHSWNLSGNAVDHLLTNRKRGGSEKEALSLDEYSVFRCIILWQMHQKRYRNNGSKAIEVKPNVLPTGTDIPSLWSSVFQSRIGSDDILPDKSRNDSVAKHALDNLGYKPFLWRLLRHINWSLIPAFLLVKVVEPLKEVSSEELLKALSFQALRSRTEFSMPKWQWRHCKSLLSDPGGKLSCISGQRDKEGSAIANLPMMRSHGIYEWHFYIHENDAGSLKFGLISRIGNLTSVQNDLNKNTLLQNSATAMWYISHGNAKTYVCRKDTKSQNHETSELDAKVEDLRSICFQLNASERTCSVWFPFICANWMDKPRAIWKEHPSAVWKDLPSAAYYPFVSFFCCKRASVQIHFEHGFDYLSLA